MHSPCIDAVHRDKLHSLFGHSLDLRHRFTSSHVAYVGVDWYWKRQLLLRSQSCDRSGAVDADRGRTLQRFEEGFSYLHQT